MRNIFGLTISAVLLAVVLGCGAWGRLRDAAGPANVSNTNAGSNKTIADKAIDTAVSGEKVGIQECDDVIDILASQTNNPDDNFVTRAVKATALSTFRQQLKKSLDNNNANPTNVAKFCRDFKSNLSTPAGGRPANSR